MIEKLRSRYWARLEAQHRPGAWEDLNARYSDTRRAYHSWTHIADLLQKLDDLSYLATRRPIIATAIFWHDAVHLTQNADGSQRSNHENVKDSTELFQRYTLLEHPDADAVHDMIIATADHIEAKAKTEYYPGFSDDLDFFLDLDLSSLGASWEKFVDNFTKIQFEFSWVPEPIFLSSQIETLGNFARNDDRLYRRMETRSKWAASAKSNLTRFLTELVQAETDIVQPARLDPKANSVT
ncbi:MAG: hypothetical protein WCD63_17245 [Terrimicrobiaceae bacterium]